MKDCPRCEKQVDTSKKFCSACGFDFHTIPDRDQKVHTAETKKIAPIVSEITEEINIIGGRFEPQEKIGEGGMATVFRTLDLLLNDVVALKILKPEFASDKASLDRFKREVKIARKITHPNVCRIYDLLFLEEVKCITMEFIKGISLMSWLADNESPSLEHKLTIASGVLLGLRAAHNEHIIHRDLKPANIMIKQHHRPMIMDFGISRFSGEKGESDITKKGEIMGTVDYMSPEQFQGQKLDHRTDIYSFGVVLYQLFAGKLPFQGSNALSIAMAHVQTKPKSARLVNLAIPETLDRLIMKCLEKNPDDRYQNVDEVIDALTHKPLQVLSDTRKRILVAEDDENIRKILGHVFERKNYFVINAVNGEEAITKCIQFKPDLFCTDIMMPQMDGLQSIEFIIENPILKNIPIIVISAKTDKAYIAYCKSLGVREYFVKPFNPFEILEFIQKILGDDAGT